MAYCVYKHTNKINNKVYIGQTMNIQDRWSRQGGRYKGCTYFFHAIQKYGWDNFLHEILEDNLTNKEANEKEQYYIKLYDSTNPEKGYNLAPGGEAGGHIKGKDNPINKPIICLETLKIYPSARIAGEELGIDESCIRKVCRGDRASAGGYRWADYDENKTYTKPKKVARGAGNTRPVKCIETGEIFSSCLQAAKVLQEKSPSRKLENIANLIGRVCRGAQQSTGGYHYCYEEEV